MVIISVAVWPAASVAIAAITFSPCARLMLETDQLTVPDADPEPPLSLNQVTRVTPTLSEAVPPMLMTPFVVLWVAREVGEVIVTVGLCVSGGIPLSSSDFWLSL